MAAKQGVRRYMRAGLVAGLAAATLNSVVFAVMVSVGGYALAPVVVGSILVASLLPNLIAALAYYALARFTGRARAVLTLGIFAFVVISILPHLGIGPAPSPALAALPEGFELLTVPLHIVFGLTAVFVMPRLVDRAQPAPSPARLS